MTKPRPLGSRQADVLRAAAAGKLIRFDDGGWAADGHACTQPARTVAAIEPALLADGKRGAVVTGGSWKSRPGTWMGLTDEGQRVLDAYDAAHPEEFVDRKRRADALNALSGMTGDALMAGVRDLAAAELGVDDGAFRILGRAVNGRDITTGD